MLQEEVARHHYSRDDINNYCYDMTFVLFQSVLKNIPVVGSLFGWFVSSPISGSKGRTFSLQSGKFLNCINDPNEVRRPMTDYVQLFVFVL